MNSSAVHMKIIVNGEEQTYNAPLTVTVLLQELNLRTEQVAVEVNLNILDRSNFSTWTLQENDKVEILSFIGGGSPQPKHSEGRKRHE
ncbi:MAG: sulfur carrier protein ThiS [Nitrospirales bacterium]